MLHESNAFPGKAVKMLAKKTDTIMVSFEDAIPRIDSKNKIVCTGTPVKNQKRDYTVEEKNEIIKSTKERSIVWKLNIYQSKTLNQSGIWKYQISRML